MQLKDKLQMLILGGFLYSLFMIPLILIPQTTLATLEISGDNFNAAACNLLGADITTCDVDNPAVPPYTTPSGSSSLPISDLNEVPQAPITTTNP